MQEVTREKVYTVAQLRGVPRGQSRYDWCFRRSVLDSHSLSKVHRTFSTSGLNFFVGKA